MAHSVVFAPLAEADLDAIVEYIPVIIRMLLFGLAPNYCHGLIPLAFIRMSA